MTIQVTDAQRFKIFRRTDVQSDNAIIFAHGQNNGGQCVVPGTTSVHFYINDNTIFNFAGFTFTFAFEGKLMPVQSFSGGASADYTLKKAAGSHIPNPHARHSYGDLGTLADGSDGHARAHAADPGQNIHLGQGVPCDIISVRNRVFQGAPTLSDIVHDPLMAQYTHLHCFFCRASQNGNTPANAAPNKVSR